MLMHVVGGWSMGHSQGVVLKVFREVLSGCEGLPVMLDWGACGVLAGVLMVLACTGMHMGGR